MVLINNLTVDDINAALIHLQRSKNEVVGGTKGDTIQNININNAGGGSSGGGYDYSPFIQELRQLIETNQTDIQSIESNINEQSEINQTQQQRINDLMDVVNFLVMQSITLVTYDANTRVLAFYSQTSRLYQCYIPEDAVSLEFVEAENRLVLKSGTQTVSVVLPYINASEKGAANGVATLDSSGRIPYSQLPESAMEFKGEWDASTNTPHLQDGTGVNGDFYIVSTGGTVNLGTQQEPREITFYPNDRIIYEGDTDEWFRIPAGTVISVNGKSGVVVLDATDIMYDSSQTVKQKIDNIAQSDWTEVDPTSPSFIKHKIPIWITSGSADDNMSPINSVTNGSTRPVTSGAVYDAMQNVQTQIPAYDTQAQAEADLANLSVGQTIEVKEGTDGVIDAVVDGDMRAITSNAVYDAMPKYVTADGASSSDSDIVPSKWDIIEFGTFCICFGLNKGNFTPAGGKSMQLPSGYTFKEIVSANVFCDAISSWSTAASHIFRNGAYTYITGTSNVSPQGFRQIVLATKS